MIRKLAKTLLPANSKRRKLVKKPLVKVGLMSSVTPGYYDTWYGQQAEHPSLGISSSQILREGPLISIVVPAYNTPKFYLEELVYSIISQSYEKWELILVNASSNPVLRSAINKCAEKDSRIRSIEVNNEGISANTNAGIKVAKGSYITFCDHDDTLDPGALYEVAQKIIDEAAELVYSDEDKISDNGEVYFDPHFKPEWSPDLLTHVNYINHLTTIKKSLIEKVGLLSPEKDGAQDYDLVLRITALRPKIAHIPKVLYHWRAVKNSTATDFSSKKNITNAAKSSLEQHFKELGSAVTVRPKADRPGFYQLLFESPKEVSVIVPPFASDALVRMYVDLLLKKTDVENLQVELLLSEKVNIETDKKIFSTKAIAATETFLSDAVRAASHEQVVIINQIALPQSKEWLKSLCGPLQLSHTKTVAPLIVRDGNVVEDCGLVTDATGSLIPLFRDQPAHNNQTFFGNTDWVRNVDAVSGGIVALRRSELADFLKSAAVLPARQLIQQFSLHQTTPKKYNTIFPDATLDNHSIRLAPAGAKQSFFNPNLFALGRDYELYTPEPAAVTILKRLIMDVEYP
jgi:glycosyltransferase involved in cell wall biosynthesis